MKLPRIKRLFQFSLRTMLVVMVVLSVWLGWKVRQAKQQKAAVEWVRELNGTGVAVACVVYDHQVKAGWRWDSEAPGPKWLRDLIGVNYFATVVNVFFVDVHGEVTDVSPLSAFTNLDTLTFTSDGISDLSPLANLTNLKTLVVGGVNVSDVTPLANLTKLRVLGLTDTSVADLSPLAALSNLRRLRLESTQVTDLAPLVELPSLVWLRLINIPATDLTPLTKLTRLTDLDLRDTRVTDEEVAKLKKALPNCEVIYE